METFTLYLLKVNSIFTVMFLFYLFFLRRDTFYVAKRFYFLFTVLVSVLLPFIHPARLIPQQESLLYTLVIINRTLSIPASVGSSTVVWPWINLGLIVAGTVAMTIFIIRYVRLYYHTWKCRRTSIMNTTVYVTHGDMNPFSFNGKIYLNPGNYTDQELANILEHELAHIRQGHALDVFITGLFRSLAWMNPFYYLFVRASMENIEFLADAQVIARGNDPREYQYLLLRVARSESIELTQHFNILNLKKRIIMMNKKRTHKLWTSKYILALPLILLLLMALNAKELMAAWENSKLSPKSSEKIIVLQSGNSSGQLPPVSVIKNLTSQQVAELIRTDTLRTARKKSRIWGSMGNNDSIYYYDHNGNKIHPSKQEIDEFNEVNRQRFSEITKSFRETNFQFKDLWKDDSLRKKYQIDFSKEMEKFRFHADTINLHINTDKLLKEMQDIEFSTKNFNLFYDDLKSQKLSDKDIKELKESMEKLNKMLDDPKFKENMEELRQGMRDLRLKLNRQEFGIYDFQPKLKNDSLFFNRYFRKKTEKPTVSVEIKPEVEPFKRLDKADADIRFMLLDHSQSSGLN